jgi:hypothetical protein
MNCSRDRIFKLLAHTTLLKSPIPAKLSRIFLTALALRCHYFWARIVARNDEEEQAGEGMIQWMQTTVSPQTLYTIQAEFKYYST